jgi:hypothetical protein
MGSSAAGTVEVREGRGGVCASISARFLFNVEAAVLGVLTVAGVVGVVAAKAWAPNFVNGFGLSAGLGDVAVFEICIFFAGS